MSSNAISRKVKFNPFGIVIPPGGRLHWISSEDELDLIYLFWGWRRYGDAPLPRSRNIGWEYTCLLEGNPVFEVDGVKVPLKVGQLIVTGPNRVITISDKPGSQCQILTCIPIPIGNPESPIPMPERKF